MVEKILSLGNNIDSYINLTGLVQLTKIISFVKISKYYSTQYY